MDGFIVGSILLVGIIILYFLTYILNKKTEVPQGITPLSKCSTCGNGSCSLKDKENFLGNEDEECDIFIDAISNHD